MKEFFGGCCWWWPWEWRTLGVADQNNLGKS